MAKCAERRLRRCAARSVGRHHCRAGAASRGPRGLRVFWSLGRRLGDPGPSRCSGTPPSKPRALRLAALAAPTHLIVAAGRARGRG